MGAAFFFLNICYDTEERASKKRTRRSDTVNITGDGRRGGMVDVC
jgi:hypothetical protein